MSRQDINIRINIDGNTKNLSVARKEVNRLGLAAGNVDTVMNSLRGTIGKVAIAGVGLATIPDALNRAVGAMDNLRLVEGRLKLVTSSTQELANAKAELLSISNESRVGLNSTVDLYARLGRSLKELKPSQDSMLDVTEAINKTLILSGASTASAEAALMQLGQGFASGALRGQELMSVMEQTPRLAEAIASGMGVTIGELRKLGEEGKLTASQVYEAILSQKDVIEKEFGQMPLTIGQSMTVLANNVTMALGRMDQSIGLVDTLSRSIILIGENTDAIATLGFQIGASLLIWKSYNTAISLYNTHLKAAPPRLNYLTGATKTLTVAQRAHLLVVNSVKTAYKTFLPFAVISALTAAATAVWELFDKQRERAEMLSETLGKTSEQLKNLTKDQLAYRKAMLEAEMVDVLGKRRDLSVDIGNDGWFESKEEQLRDRNHYDELGARLQTIKTTLNEIRSIEKGTLDKASTKDSSSLSDSIEVTAKNLKAFEEVARTAMSEYESELLSINLKTQGWIESGVSVNEALAAQDRLIRQLDNETLKEHQKALEESAKAMSKTFIVDAGKAYDALNDYSMEGYEKALALREKLLGLAPDEESAKAIESLFEKKINTLNDFMVQSHERASEQIGKELRKVSTAWENMTSTMAQSFNDNIFSFITGKTSSLGDAFKSLGNDILSNFTNSFGRSASGSLTTLVSSAIGIGGDMNSILRDAGLSLVDGQWIGGGETGGAPNIVVSAAGEIVKGGNLLSMQTLGALGDMKTAYSVFTTGLSESVQGLFVNGASMLESLGFTSASTSVAGFGVGFANPFSINAGLGASGSVAWGAGTSAAGIGGIGGYLLGTGLDSLFGTKTQAGNVGAIGGALGGIVGTSSAALGAMYGSWAGPIGMAVGAVIGAIIGGLNGSWEQKATGFRLEEDISADYVEGIKSYELWKNKSWGGTKKNEVIKDIDEGKIREIATSLGILQDFSDSLGGGKIEIAAGTYLSENHTVKRFSDAMGKALVVALTGIPATAEEEVAIWGIKSIASMAEGIRNGVSETVTRVVENPELSEIYKVWENYAKSVDSTAFEAIQDYIGKVMQMQREYSAWMLKDDQAALALKQAQYAQEDVERAAKVLGVNFAELTTEQFLNRYNTAVKESFDPTVIDQWNLLANAFMSAKDAQMNYTNAVLSASTQMYNTQVRLAQAFGENTAKLQKDYLYGQAITLGTAISGQDYEISDVDAWIRELQRMDSAGRAAYISGSSLQASLVESLIGIIEFKDSLNTSLETVSYHPVNNAAYESATAASLLTAELEDLIDTMADGARSLENAARTSRRVLDTLYDEDSGYIVSQYSKYLQEAKDFQDAVLANPLDREATEGFDKSLSSLSQYVDEYLDPSRFESQWEHRLAMATARNDWSEFEQSASMHDTLKDVESVLREQLSSAKNQEEISEAIATATRRLSELIESVSRGAVALRVSNE